MDPSIRAFIHPSIHTWAESRSLNLPLAVSCL